MDAAIMFIAAAILMAIAAYAQYHIRFHTVASRIAMLRAVLALVGIAFGYTVTAVSGAQGLTALFAFLAGFGIVHGPAAIILFFKRLRREGRS
jgi:uncharacterized membrane protein